MRQADSITEFELDFQRIPAAEHSTHLLQIHRNEFVSSWAKVKDSYDEIAASTDTFSSKDMSTIKEDSNCFINHTRVVWQL